MDWLVIFFACLVSIKSRQLKWTKWVRNKMFLANSFCEPWHEIILQTILYSWVTAGSHLSEVLLEYLLPNQQKNLVHSLNVCRLIISKNFLILTLINFSKDSLTLRCICGIYCHSHFHSPLTTLNRMLQDTQQYHLSLHSVIFL